MTFRMRVLVAAGLSICVSPAVAQERLLWHDVRLDDQGKLLSWMTGDSPYDRLVTSAWGAFKKVPVQPNGYRTYFTFPTFYGPNDPNHPEFSGRGWCHNPGSLCAMIADSALLYHAYSGDRAALDRAREMIDHFLAHGTTEKTDAWALVPYSSSDAGVPDYRGATDANYSQDNGKDLGRGDGVGFLEPDKVGELGYAYLSFYELTLKDKYLQAAIRCADALAKHVRKPDESHSPWPFRVDAKTGTKIREQYSSNVIGPIRLFDELIRLGLGHVAAYKRTRKVAWDWMMAFPMRNNVWCQYFEDILIYPDYSYNRNQYSPMETARYLMQHPELDPLWREDVKSLLTFVTNTFAVDSKTMAGLPEKGNQWGAEVVSEQFNDMDKMSSHTARFASVLALWYEKTGDPAAKERAFRSFNWATYSLREGGLVKTSLDVGTGYWFSDGYGDFMRHFQRGMASIPEWAPAKSDHLLRSTSVVRAIRYSPNRIGYSTFDKAGEEVLRVRRLPTSVLVGIKSVPRLRTLSAGNCFTASPLPGGGYVVRVKRVRSGSVVVRL